MKIWVVQNRDHDRSSVFGVYSNIDKAMADIKSFYDPTNVLTWLKPQQIWEGFLLTGFEADPGFSPKHTYDFTFREWILDEGWQDRKARYANE